MADRKLIEALGKVDVALTELGDAFYECDAEFDGIESDNEDLAQLIKAWRPFVVQLRALRAIEMEHLQV